MADFDYKKFVTEHQSFRVSELARIAKEKYKLNPEFPDLENRIKNPSDYKDDRRQQIINYFVTQAKDQGVDPMDIELLKSKIEKETVPGKSFTLIPDLKQNLLRSTSVQPEEEPEEEPSEDDVLDLPDNEDDLFVGTTKLSKRKSDEEEPEEEPSDDEIEKAEPILAPKISDQDFEDSLKYSELQRRLAATRGNILSLRKSRPTAGDIKDRPSDELQRLRDLKVSLEQRIADLVAKSPYLQKIDAQSAPPPPPVEEPEEEPSDEEQLDEYIINRMKYYAGIIK
jgi:hypothetical protein